MKWMWCATEILFITATSMLAQETITLPPNGVIFNKLDTRQLFVNYNILCLEQDKIRPENIIFSTRSAIYTAKTTTNTVTLLAGHPTQTGAKNGNRTTARFNGILSFTQLSKFRIVLVDSGNRMIKKFIRNSILGRTSGSIGESLVTWIAGNTACCSRVNQIPLPNTLTQPLSYARFYKLQCILAHPEEGDKFFISDRFSIRLLNLYDDTEKILTVDCVLGTIPLGCKNLALDLPSLTMYIGASNHLATFNMETKQIKLLTSEFINFKTETHSLDKFSFIGVADIKLILPRSSLIVADRLAWKLYEVDLERRLVRNICDGTQGLRNSTDIDNCRIEYPQALLKWDDSRIFIGTPRGIRQLYFTIKNVEKIDPTTLILYIVSISLGAVIFIAVLTAMIYALLHRPKVDRLWLEALGDIGPPLAFKKGISFNEELVQQHTISDSGPSNASSNTKKTQEDLVLKMELLKAALARSLADPSISSGLLWENQTKLEKQQKITVTAIEEKNRSRRIRI